MRLAVITAAPGASWEAQFVAAAARGEFGCTVVRRCVELADLLAVASAGTADVALVATGLRGLDREVVARLRLAGVAVVAVGDAADVERARLIGVADALVDSATAAELADAAARAVTMAAEPTATASAEFSSINLPRQPEVAGHSAPNRTGAGRVVAVWGPTGAPGRTTVAVGLANELAVRDVDTMIVDADVYGGAVTTVLGVLDEAPGVVAAVRAAANGSLDVAALAGHARSVRRNLRVLTGIAHAQRWPELKPSAVAAMLATSRGLSTFTVVDCGFCLEQDEELAYDTTAPRRNGGTLAVLAEADTVVAVGAADQVGLARLVRGLADLREILPEAAPVVVLNRLRRGVTDGDAETEVVGAVQRFAGVRPAAVLPFDAGSVDAAVRAGEPLDRVAPNSPLRLALATLAADIAGLPMPRRHRKLSRRG